MTTFIRLNNTILQLEHVSSVTRTADAVEIRMIRLDGSAEPHVIRFEGAEAACAWNAFAEMGDPDLLERAGEYEGQSETG